MNRSTFLKQLTLIGTATNKELSPGLSDLWWQKYGALPDEVLFAAFALVVDTCEFFPAPAKFNELLRQVAGSTGAVVDGESAWAYLQSRTVRKFRPGVAIRDPGDPDPFRSKQDPLDWPDELARRIVREELGGIYALAVTEGEYAREQQRKRFVKSYDSVQAVERAEAQLDAPKLRAIGTGREVG
jgi:hypothetical protein